MTALRRTAANMNGFDSSRLDTCAVCAAAHPDPDPEPDTTATLHDNPTPDEELDEDAWPFAQYPNAPEPPGIGEVTRDDMGVESGVFPVLLLSSSAVGAHIPFPFLFPFPSGPLPFMGASIIPCRMNSDVFRAAPERRLK